MPLFTRWTSESPDALSGEKILREAEGGREAIWTELLEIVRSHLLDPEPWERLGMRGFAKILETKLPTSARARSADLGEIIGSEYVEDETDFSLFIKRLRWKDGRNVSLRGDDLIGLSVDDGSPTRILKGEIKSRVNLSKAVVSAAIEKLAENHGEPDPHTLTWLVERLCEAGLDHEALAVLEFLKSGVGPGRLVHLVFTFSGNDPTSAFAGHAASASERTLVGLVVEGHADFVKKVFEECSDVGS